MTADYQEIDCSTGVAIVGMAGRLPGANSLKEFWRNLANGVEAVRNSTSEELAVSGVPVELINDSRFVSACGRLDDIELFDATFFGMTPREADITSPQQRLLMETAQLALDDAGYFGAAFDHRIGLFAGVETSDYEYEHLHSRPDLYNTLGYKTIQFANDIAFSATQVAYRLNLTGPAINVSTACSSSLTAMHLACKSLLNFECEMALAGGASYSVNQHKGYLFQEGGIGSPDGHCRAFDASARGTISGNGAGMVLLKRLDDALEDRDAIYAVILATAINNDGNNKVGYAAPGLEGQANVIADALTFAGVSADRISYVEAHGTGTSLGDPIEVAALTEAFRETSNKVGNCALGALKSNIGHLGCAAGVAGAIKTALALSMRQIPPTINVDTPNPGLKLETSPFYLNTTLQPWKPQTGVRLAGVSSFGMGGTNVHAILQSWQLQETGLSTRDSLVFLFSGASALSLQANLQAFCEHVREVPEISLADAAYTLKLGRRPLAHRFGIVADDRDTLIDTLGNVTRQHAVKRRRNAAPVFMFPGQGNQRLAMASSLYNGCPSFKTHIDECAELANGELGVDIRTFLIGQQGDMKALASKLERTEFAQCMLFVVEYALAMSLIDLGVRPSRMIGHSVGEYVAATIAGVFELKAALRLVVFRGRLMQRMKAGTMTVVHLGEHDVTERLPESLDVAVVNGLSNTVVSGEQDEVTAFMAELEADGVRCRRLQTSHAFHSRMMEPCLGELQDFVAKQPLNEPQIPYVSNATGKWITPHEACDPAYWSMHARSTVRFADGLHTLAEHDDSIYLEVGPGRSIAELFKNDDGLKNLSVHSCLSHPKSPRSDNFVFNTVLAAAWCYGVDVDWSVYYGDEQRARVHLPGYQFERQRHWIDRIQRPDTSFVQAPSIAVVSPLPVEQHTGERHDTATQAASAIESDVSPRPASLSMPYEEPQTETEKQVARTWSEILGVAPVGLHDNFFELGGSSLLLVQFATIVLHKFSLQLPAHEFFELQTVSEVATRISEYQNGCEQNLQELEIELADLSEKDLMAALLELAKTG